MAATKFFWRQMGAFRSSPEAGTEAKQGRECTCKARAVWLPRARGGQSQSRKTFNTCKVPEGTIGDSKTSTKAPKLAS